jgi:hypothetical protein
VRKVLLLIFTFLLASVSLGADKIKLAFIGLEASGVSESTATGISEIILDTLINTRRFYLVERSQLTALLEEQALSLSGCTSAECLIQVGQLAGADKALVGKVSQVGRVYLLTVRLADVYTGELEYSDSAEAPTVEDLLDEGRQIAQRLSESIPVRGTIVSIDNEYITINLGKQDGMKIGDELEIFRIGEEYYHPVSGLYIGCDIIEVGAAVVNRVIDASLSQAWLLGDYDVVEGDKVVMSGLRGLSLPDVVAYYQPKPEPMPELIPEPEPEPELIPEPEPEPELVPEPEPEPELVPEPEPEPELVPEPEPEPELVPEPEPEPELVPEPEPEPELVPEPEPEPELIPEPEPEPELVPEPEPEPELVPEPEPEPEPELVPEPEPEPVQPSGPGPLQLHLGIGYPFIVDVSAAYSIHKNGYVGLWLATVYMNEIIGLDPDKYAAQTGDPMITLDYDYYFNLGGGFRASAGLGGGAFFRSDEMQYIIKVKLGGEYLLSPKWGVSFGLDYFPYVGEIHLDDALNVRAGAEFYL